MSNSYVLLEKIVVGSAGASSVTFANIPQTGYTDLVVKASVRNATGLDHLQMAFNGSTSTYTLRSLRGNGSAAASFVGSDYGVTAAIESGYYSSDTSTFSNTEIYIPNYTSSNAKSVSIDAVQEANATTAYMVLNAGLWSGTGAITSIVFSGQGYSFAANSTFYLYGVAKLGTTPTIAPKATGGDVVMTDGTYWYHAFRSSGTFTPQILLSCDVLVVAGGGGAAIRGNRGAGGGGAGGLLHFASQSLSPANYTVTVGAGGSGSSSTTHTNGSNSVFGALTTVIGGGKGSPDTGGGSSGGSGGGGWLDESGYGATSGQGNTGGNGSAFSIGDNTFQAGGGGGATAGGNSGTTNGGNGGTNGRGGAGSSTYSSYGAATGTGQNVSGTYWYAGGGGGGSGKYLGGNGYTSVAGNGGGGAGSGLTTGNGASGLANTGGGGGGANAVTSGSGGAGGSGIVIVRYLVA
jgi:hypothetical protein